MFKIWKNSGIDLLKHFATLLLLILLPTISYQQCDLSVPAYDIDLVGNPDGVVTSSYPLGGECCNAQPGSNSCLVFNIVVDETIAGIGMCFDPPCSIEGYPDFSCPLPGNSIDLCKDEYCVPPGVNNVEFLICKPGNANNALDISIIAIPALTAKIETTIEGCSTTYQTTSGQIPQCAGGAGDITYFEPTLQWSSTDDPNLDYLSCTDCPDPVFSYTGPPLTTNECGGIIFEYTLTAAGVTTVTECIDQDPMVISEAVVLPDLEGFFTTECAGNDVTITFVPNVFCSDNDYFWFDQSNNFISDELSITVPNDGTNYTMVVENLQLFGNQDCMAFVATAEAYCCVLEGSCILSGAVETVEGCSVNDLPLPLSDYEDVFNIETVCSNPIMTNSIESTSGSACTSDPLLVTRRYIFIDDLNDNGVLDFGEETIICDQFFSIIDTTVPVAPNPPADFFGQCISDVPSPVALTALDACDGDITVSPTDSTVAGSCPNSFVTTRSWTFTDACGNSTAITQTITIEDTEVPAFSAPPTDFFGQCVEDVPPPVDLSVTDNCDGVITVGPTEETVAGTCSNSFVTTRTWTYTDACGNSASVNQTITIEDNTAPSMTTPPSDFFGQCATDIPSLVDLTANDNCDGDITVSPTETQVQGSCANDFVITRTWLFEDECGNVNDETQLITIQDNTAPIAPTPPSNIVAQCDLDIPTAIDLTATDNCDGAITVSPTETTEQGSCPNSIIITRTWTFVDLCGNMSDVSQIITIEDTTAPATPTPPANVFAQCDAEVPALVDLTAVDNCDGDITVSPTENITAGACPSSFIITRTWTFVDACANTSSVSQTITVEDTTAPVPPTPPADFVGQCASDVPSPIDLIADDNCDGQITVSPTESIEAGSCTNEFTITRTWTFTDACGNTSSVSQMININDDTAPVPPSPPADVIAQCNADIPAPTQLVATDNCDGTIVADPTESITQGSCPNEFTLVRTWTFIDGCGNTSSVSQTIAISDTTVPVVPTPPADFVGECADEVPAPIDLTAIDNCDGDITVSPNDDITPGACATTFTITRTWTFIDGCGNTSSVSQLITISDTTAPDLPVTPPDFTGECTSEVPTAVSLTATDNCQGSITVGPTETTVQGSCPNEFVTTRTWTFTDECGNTSSTSQVISISDNSAPIAPSAPADFSGQCAADVPAAISLTAVDNCDGDITVLPTDSTVAGTCPNTFVTTRTWTFVDQCGNTSSVSQLISIEDNTPPMTPTPPAGVFGQCLSIIPAPIDLTASDNCDGDITVSPTETIVAGSCPNATIITRTWTFTDDCGNTSSVSQTINIEDTTAPLTPTPPASTSGECSADIPAPVDLTALDNCDGNITVSPTEQIIPGLCSGAFDIVRTWTFTDDCGNSSSVSQTISIGDTTAPTPPAPPADFSGQCLDDVPMPVEMTATDNCGEEILASPIDDIQPGDCPNSFNITRTWTFVDDCGNTSELIQNIIISDQTAPQLPSAPADLVIQCSGEIPDAIDLEAIDNCDGVITVSPTEQFIPGACPNDFQIIRTWTFVDECGNASSISQTIISNDISSPIIQTAPEDLNLQCADDIPAPISLTAVDNCDGDMMVMPTSTTIQGICANQFTMTRTWTFVDQCGNMASESQIINVSDDMAPVTPISPVDITVSCSADVPAAEVLVAIDNCEGEITATSVDVITESTCINNYVIDRVWTFNDECGNSSTLTQIISVIDEDPPVFLEVPEDLLLNCASEVPEQEDIMATDNCSGSFTVSPSETIVAGDCINSFVITRTWQAADGCGNNSIAQQTITVHDEKGPVANDVPQDLVLECSPVPAGQPLNAMDECDGSFVADPIDTYIQGACANEYTVLRAWTFADQCGNVSTYTQTIQVVDSEAPIIPIHLVPGFENMVDGGTMQLACETNDEEFLLPDLSMLEDMVYDECGSEFTYELIDEFLGPGECVTDGYLARYRCEIIAMDDCGNTNNFEFFLEYIDETPPVFTKVPKASMTIYSCDDIPEPFEVTATDECICVHLSMEERFGSSGSTNCGNDLLTRTWTAEDHCGNISQFVQTITLIDYDAPIFPEDQLTGLDPYYCPDNIPLTSLEDIVDCNEVSRFEFEDQYFTTDCSNMDILARFWLMEDDCGNQSTITQFFYILNGDYSGVEMRPDGDVLSSFEFETNNIVTQDELNQILSDPKELELFFPHNCNFDYDIEVDFDEFEFDCTSELEKRVVINWTIADYCGNQTERSLGLDVLRSSYDFSGLQDTIQLFCNEIIPTLSLDDAFTVTYSDVILSSDCLAQRVMERTYSISSDCGMADSFTQTIITKEVKPEFPLTDLICQGEIENEYVVTSPCGSHSIKYILVSSNVLSECTVSQRIEHTYISDLTACGNIFEEKVIQIIDDTQGPSLVSDNNLIQSILDGTIQTIYTSNLSSYNTLMSYVDNHGSFSVFGADDCGEITDLDTSIDTELFDCAENNGIFKAINLSWSTQDFCGNLTELTRRVDVVDNQGPRANQEPFDVEYTCQENEPAIPLVTFTDENSYDVEFEIVTISTEPSNQVTERIWTATDICGNETIIDQRISFRPQIVECAILTADTIICNTSGNLASFNEVNNNYNYSWSIDGDGCYLTSGQNSPEVEFTVGFSEFTLNLDVIDENGCLISCQKIISCTSKKKTEFKDNEVEQRLAYEAWSAKILPNPTRDIFSLQIENFIEEDKLLCEIYDAKGQTILQQEILSSHSSLSLEGLPNGVYTLLLQNNKQSKMLRVIKIE